MTTDIVTTRIPSRARVDALRALVSWQLVGALALFVALAVVFQLNSDGVFLGSRNLSLMLRQGALIAVVACGVAVLMIMSEIDLSIGSAVFLCGVLGAKAQTDWGLGPVFTVVVMVLGGVVLGLWQGFAVTRLMVPSFIVTLAGMLAFRGIGLSWSDARTISPLAPGFIDMSEAFVSPGLTVVGAVILFALAALVIVRRGLRARRRGLAGGIERAALGLVVTALVLVAFVLTVNGFLGTPTALLWVLAVGITLTFLMRRTVWGRNAYMIGANKDAAQLAGVPVARTIMLGFVLMGALYGVGAVLLTANVGASTANGGTFLELDAIAAAVIGGVSLRGGSGRIPAVLAGALLLTMIDNGMTVMNVSSFTQDTVKGAILLLAVALDCYVSRRPARAPRVVAPEAAAS